MAGNVQSIGVSGLVFGPVRIDGGPKGCTTHFTVTSTQIGNLIAYWNYAVQFGATISAHGFDVGVDGHTSAFDKHLDVSVPGVTAELNGVIAQLYFDSWEFLTNEGTDTIFANPLMTGGSWTGGAAAPYLNYNAKVILSDLVRNGGTLIDSVARVNGTDNAFAWGPIGR